MKRKQEKIDIFLFIILFIFLGIMIGSIVTAMTAIREISELVRQQTILIRTIESYIRKLKWNS